MPEVLAESKLSRGKAFRRAIEGLMIRDERGLIRPLKFVESQEIIWKFVEPKLDAHEKLWFIVLKGRQVYASTFFEGLTFIRTLAKPNTNSLVIAQDLDSSTNIFNMVKRFYDYLPLPKLTPGKVKELEFPLPGGPSFFKVVSAGVASKGRGTTQTCIHASEVAFWPHPEVLAGLFQAIPDIGDTLWVLESTANGLMGQGEMFYRQWKSAVSGRSSLTPIFIPWFVMQKYRAQPAVPEDEWDDEEKALVSTFGDPDEVERLFGARGVVDGEALRWRRNTIETKTQGSVEIFHQEYPSTPDEAFISSGLPAFDPVHILRQARNVRPPTYRLTLHGEKLVSDKNGEVFLWQEPQDGHQYVIGADTSEGMRGGDYSCAQIIDMDTLRQVGLVHGLIAPYDFAKLLNKVGRWYNTAMINVEVQSAGIAVQDILMRTFNYPRFHPWLGKPDHYRTDKVRLWGWVTNVYSRPLLIEAGRKALSHGSLTLHDEATLDELKHFSRNDNGKFEASAGHDDRVIALLLALRSREENYTVTSARQFYNKELALTEPDVSGVRIVQASESQTLTLSRVHKMLKQAAKGAVKNWMQL